MQKPKSSLRRESILKTPVLTKREPTNDGFCMSFESPDKQIAPPHAPENTFIGYQANPRQATQRSKLYKEHSINKNKLCFPVKIRSEYEIYQVENDFDFSEKRFRYSKVKAVNKRVVRPVTSNDNLVKNSLSEHPIANMPFVNMEEANNAKHLNSSNNNHVMSNADKNLIKTYYNQFNSSSSSSWSGDATVAVYPLITCRNYSKESSRQTSQHPKSSRQARANTPNPLYASQWINHTMLPTLGKIKTTSFNHHRRSRDTDLLENAYADLEAATFRHQMQRPMMSMSRGQTSRPGKSSESLNFKINKLAKDFPAINAMRCNQNNQTLPNLSKFLHEKSIKYEMV
jgi:hypothetical protein